MPTSTSPLVTLFALPVIRAKADSGEAQRGDAATASGGPRCSRRCAARVKTSLLAGGRPLAAGAFDPRREGSSTVPLAPHADSIGVGDMTVPPFRLMRPGGHLLGCDTGDRPSPAVARLVALWPWRGHPSRLNPQARVNVAAAAGAEQRSLGAACGRHNGPRRSTSPLKP